MATPAPAAKPATTPSDAPNKASKKGRLKEIFRRPFFSVQLCQSQKRTIPIVKWIIPIQMNKPLINKPLSILHAKAVWNLLWRSLFRIPSKTLGKRKIICGSPLVILLFSFGMNLGSVHNSSRGNLLAQKRACRVENARKVPTLLRFSPCKRAFALKILRTDELWTDPRNYWNFKAHNHGLPSLVSAIKYKL